MKLILIGAGQRGMIYASYARERGHELVAVAEPDARRREAAGELLGISDHHRDFHERNQGRAVQESQPERHVLKDDVSDEYIETYRHWDDEAIPSAMLGFAFNNAGFEAKETACNEAWKKLAPILYGYVDFDENYPAAIAELEAAGIEEYVTEVNRQLEAFMAK